jgi:hypothetical protein
MAEPYIECSKGIGAWASARKGGATAMEGSGENSKQGLSCDVDEVSQVTTT